MAESGYLQFSKAELRQEVDRRGIQASSGANKEDLAELLSASDGGNEGGEPTATVYSLPDYEPTEEERLRDKLVGYHIAARAVEGQKQVSGGQPIYDETIEELNDKVKQLKAELGLG